MYAELDIFLVLCWWCSPELFCLVDIDRAMGLMVALAAKFREGNLMLVDKLSLEVVLLLFCAVSLFITHFSVCHVKTVRQDEGLRAALGAAWAVKCPYPLA